MGIPDATDLSTEEADGGKPDGVEECSEGLWKLRFKLTALLPGLFIIFVGRFGKFLWDICRCTRSLGL